MQITPEEFMEACRRRGDPVTEEDARNFMAAGMRQPLALHTSTCESLLQIPMVTAVWTSSSS
jgi:hypothetical protein